MITTDENRREWADAFGDVTPAELHAALRNVMPGMPKVVIDGFIAHFEHETPVKKTPSKKRRKRDAKVAATRK